MKTVAPNRAVWTGEAGLYCAVVAVWRAVSADLFNTYRPEKHYMRGPGPKWHARHAETAASGADRTGIARPPNDLAVVPAGARLNRCAHPSATAPGRG